MRKADNLPPYRAVVMKSGSLNFLEPSGPAQACYGTALPFFYTYFIPTSLDVLLTESVEIVSLRNVLDNYVLKCYKVYN